MYKLLLKLILIATTASIYFQNSNEYNYIIIALLIAISASTLIDISKKFVANAVFIIFFITSISFPILTGSYPIIIGASSKINKYLLAIPILILISKKNVDILIISLCILAYLTCFLIDELIQYKKAIYEKDDILNITINEKNLEAIKLAEERSKDVEIAILSERNRISKELHDSIGHTISGAIIQTEAIKLLSNENLKPQIDKLQENLKSGMGDIRATLHKIHDDSLDLKLKINEVAKNNTKLKYLINYKISSQLSYEAKSGIISLVKEAISNTLRHSDASSIKIELIEMPKHISIMIVDNGSVDVKSKQNFKKGIGLISFDEFAKKYDGRFKIDFDNGTKLMFLLNKDRLLKG